MNKRRDNVPFDPYYFEKQANEGCAYSTIDTFRQIYSSNHWGGAESPSGQGASSDQTHQLRLQLPTLLEQLKVEVLLDLPCGDVGWVSALELPILSYIGADIVPELIARNREQYGSTNRQFLRLDITRDLLPSADLLLCRDCFVHLCLTDIKRAMRNIKRSRILYLLTTTFPECEENEDITTGDWRLLNLERPPFNLPPPTQLINEGCSEGNGMYSDKSLGLWLIQDILGCDDGIGSGRDAV
jgi:hypothetical protein